MCSTCILFTYWCTSRAYHRHDNDDLPYVQIIPVWWSLSRLLKLRPALWLTQFCFTLHIQCHVQNPSTIRARGEPSKALRSPRVQRENPYYVQCLTWRQVLTLVFGWYSSVYVSRGAYPNVCFTPCLCQVTSITYVAFSLWNSVHMICLRLFSFEGNISTLFSIAARLSAL